MFSKWFQTHFYVSRLTSRSNLFNNNVVQNLSGITYKVRGFDEEIYRVHQDAHKESPESLLIFKATWKIVRKEIELKLGGRFTAERFLNQTSLEPTSARVQRWFYSKGRNHSCTVSVYRNGWDIFLQYRPCVTGSIMFIVWYTLRDRSSQPIGGWKVIHGKCKISNLREQHKM